jgi:ribosome-binding protein aMBF1 (putative translation factor)
MNRAKRKRLETAGWKVGSSREFLRLTDDENAMIELKLQLAKALQAERTKRRMTQEELSRKIGSSQSRVAKMEAGDPSVSLDLLVRSLFKLGVTRFDVARHLAASKKRRAA